MHSRISSWFIINWSFRRGHNSPIWALDVSALNMYVATGSRDKTARLWTLDKTYPLRLYVGHYSCVNVSVSSWKQNNITHFLFRLQTTIVAFHFSVWNFIQMASTLVPVPVIKLYAYFQSSMAKLPDYLRVIRDPYIVYHSVRMASF